MYKYSNEYPGPSDLAEVGNTVTKQNVNEAYDQLMFIKLIALLLANQDVNSGRELGLYRQADLGRLLFFLADLPVSVLGEVEVEKRDDTPSDAIRSIPLDDGGAS